MFFLHVLISDWNFHHVLVSGLCADISWRENAPSGTFAASVMKLPLHFYKAQRQADFTQIRQSTLEKLLASCREAGNSSYVTLLYHES